jgi:xylulokinase
VAISAKIDPFVDSNLSYYPLTKKGERFPIADSTKEPVLEPVPESRNEFLHGILQGIADVERDGFVILGSLGATPSRPTLVLTAGGGSKNDVWNQLRQRRLREAFGDDSLKVDKAENVEAGFGAAVLAAGAFF